MNAIDMKQRHTALTKLEEETADTIKVVMEQTNKAFTATFDHIRGLQTHLEGKDSDNLHAFMTMVEEMQRTQTERWESIGITLHRIEYNYSRKRSFWEHWKWVLIGR